MLEILKAIIFGVIEGITEWLPISSTGHLILLSDYLRIDISHSYGSEFAIEYMNMFEVVIQFGAILAVLVMYGEKLNPLSRKKGRIEKKQTLCVLGKIVVAGIPAALVGIFADKALENLTGKDIDGWLYNSFTVAVSLIFYGVLFIAIEYCMKGKRDVIADTGSISVRDAFLIGVFQMLSIVPGTSRSGATIVGARLLKISRNAAAEFSFFLGIPAILGASLIKGYGFFDYTQSACVDVPVMAWVALASAMAVAFGVSLVTIKFLTEYVKKHSFTFFGVYRILLGALVLLKCFVSGAL